MERQFECVFRQPIEYDLFGFYSRRELIRGKNVLIFDVLGIPIVYFRKFVFMMR